MTQGKWVSWAVALALLVLSPVAALAAAGDVSVQVGDGSAAVTRLTGTATVQPGGTGKATPLAKGDRLSKGDRIATAKNSRLELKLPDGSFLRFDESTTFVMVDMKTNKKKRSRSIRVQMVLGKVWARVAKLFGGGRFEIATSTAVAGVRGTVYRMNLAGDQSAMVKVYSGQVAVSKRTEASGDADAAPAVTKPFEPPRKVAGPRKVTMEEWTYLVGALQQIAIRPDGSAAPPIRFDIREDIDAWVLWNQALDDSLADG